MANLSIKSGDLCLVIAGKDKGKTGKVLAVSPSTGRVIVEGVNIVSRHKKPRSAQDQGGIIKHEAPISASNVMVVCPKCNKATRVHHKIVDGKKVRVCKCGEVLDTKFAKTAKKADKKDEPKKTRTSKAKDASKDQKQESAQEVAPEVVKEEKATKTAATKKTAASKQTKKADEKIVATKTSKVASKPAVRKTKKDV